MTYEQFTYVHQKGFKISKILDYLDRDDFEKQETLREFKAHFSKYMEAV